MLTSIRRLLGRSDSVLSTRQRRAISVRTRAALAAKREREPDWKPGRPSGISDDLRARIVEERRTNSLRAIADGLNADAVPCAQGGARWHASTIAHVLKRAAEAEERPPAHGGTALGRLADTSSDSGRSVEDAAELVGVGCSTVATMEASEVAATDQRVTPATKRPLRSTAPYAVVELEFEGPVTACIRGTNGDERQAESFRAWMALDPEMSAFCDLVRRLRDRMAA